MAKGAGDPEICDEALAARARAGDADAASTLFDRWQNRLRAEVRRSVRGIVRRRVGDSDVVQEAWMAAFARLDEFDDQGPGSFARWLKQIVRHKARDAVRRHLGTAKRGGAAEVTQGGEADDARAPDRRHRTPASQAAAREQGASVRRAMDRLTDDQRFVLECVHKKGLTFAEIGRVLGRSSNAVCKVYGRGVRALAGALGGRRVS